MQLSRFVNENRKKNRQNAFLNEKFIQKSLCLRLKRNAYNSKCETSDAQKVRGLNNDLRCPLARRLDKTTICTRSTVSSPLFLGFPLSKLLSIPQ